MIEKILSILLIGILLSGAFPAISTGGTNVIKSYNDTKTINLKKGDIVFRHVDKETYPLFKYFMHCLIFTGNIYPRSSSGKEYEFIEARGSKNIEELTVKYIRYSEYHIIDLNTFYETIFRPKANETWINNALSFAIWRIGDPLEPIYSRPVKHCDPNKENTKGKNVTWYCTEIIWAAYMNCNTDFSLRGLPEDYKGQYGGGIDIDANGGPVVLPNDILDSKNLEKVPLFVTVESDPLEPSNPSKPEQPSNPLIQLRRYIALIEFNGSTES